MDSLRRHPQIHLATLRRRLCLIACCIINLATLAYAEPDTLAPKTPPERWPKTLVLPWQLQNIDRDIHAKLRTALLDSQKSLATSISAEAKPLTDFITDKEMLTPTMMRTIERVLASNTSDQHVAMIPSLSQCQGRMIVHLIAATSDTGVLLESVHRVIPKLVWKNNQSKADATRLLNNQLKDLWADLSNKLSTQTTRSPDLGVSLENEVATLRGHEWDRDSLNLILAEQHLQDFSVISHIGRADLASVHAAWKTTGLLRRPNRTLLMTWTYETTKALTQRELPVELTLKIQPSESVFAKAIPWMIKEQVTISDATQEKISIEMTGGLKDRLTTELTALKRDEQPQASKIYGAWVYLDKGRAWGLRMNDRLNISTGDNSIKGHIVGYFGPELGLKSPRGWPIHEGAIMFVRKGQSLTKIGQEFSYDKMTVPTPWPPQATQNTK
jgi:hypothetical protein